jgi:HAD superfamily hydrolase (TIGR01509 family)
MSPRAVLFDLDGVLVRTGDLWARVLEEAGRRFRGSPVTREEFEPTFGQGTAADVRVFGLSSTPAELDRFYEESFARYADALHVDPDAALLLSALRSRGVKTALVTNTVRRLALQILETAGLTELLDAYACADMVGKPKPAPDLVEKALALVGVPPSEAWFVGDSRFDREAARAAQTRFVGLGIDGDLRVERLAEMVTLVDRALHG